TGNKGRGSVFGEQLIQRLNPGLGGRINQVRQVMLPDQVAAEDNVGIRHQHHRVSSGVSEHVTNLNQPRTEIDLNGIGINHVGHHRDLKPTFVLRFGSSSKEFQILGAQPAADVAMRQVCCPGFGKNSVPAGVVEVVVSIDHIANGQVREFANLSQQLFGGLNSYKGVHDGNTAAAHNEPRIAACFAAVRTDGS